MLTRHRRRTSMTALMIFFRKCSQSKDKRRLDIGQCPTRTRSSSMVPPANGRWLIWCPTMIFSSSPRLQRKNGHLPQRLQLHRPPSLSWLFLHLHPRPVHRNPRKRRMPCRASRCTLTSLEHLPKERRERLSPSQWRARLRDPLLPKQRRSMRRSARTS